MQAGEHTPPALLPSTARVRTEGRRSVGVRGTVGGGGVRQALRGSYTHPGPPPSAHTGGRRCRQPTGLFPDFLPCSGRWVALTAPMLHSGSLDLFPHSESRLGTGREAGGASAGPLSCPWYRPLVAPSPTHPLFLPLCLLQIPWDDNEEHLRAWEEGRTGFPWIDAIMMQLRTQVRGWEWLRPGRK